MNKYFPILVLLLLFGQVASGQNQPERPRSATVQIEANQLNEVKLEVRPGEFVYKSSVLLDIPLATVEPFLAYSVVWSAGGWDESSRFEAFFSSGGQPTGPLPIEPDSHAIPPPGRFISHLYFTGKYFKKLRLQYTGPRAIDSVEVHFYSPGNTPKPRLKTQDFRHETSDLSPLTSRSSCSCQQPAYLDRAGWCPSGDCPPGPAPTPTSVTHLIIHHSATANTASDWAAVVRSFWDWHVNVNGWDDIGYNWLIDPNGVVYEGRGDNILGAHFCGKNTGTMGVCVIGTFTDVLPTQAALDKLTDLLAWKACDADIAPEGAAVHASSGLNLHRISGHRDGCSTECPGDLFYPTIPSLRTAVKNYIENDCDGDPPSATGETGLAKNSVRIYPNPTSGGVTVTIENHLIGAMEVALYDALGRRVNGGWSYEKNTANFTFKVNLDNLPDGVYSLKIVPGGESEVFRVLKK
jgi:N-acetylmuramoyl-L-alanine amidase-like protein/type IX secretion system substrate protein